MTKGKQEKRTARKKSTAPVPRSSEKRSPNSPLLLTLPASSKQGNNTSSTKIQPSTSLPSKEDKGKKLRLALLIAFSLEFLVLFILPFEVLNDTGHLKSFIASPLIAFGNRFVGLAALVATLLGLRSETFSKMLKPLPSWRVFTGVAIPCVPVYILIFVVVFIQWPQLPATNPPKRVPPIIYEQHSPVTALAWSPDGERIASASVDGTVQVWVAASGQRLLTYKGHTGKVNALAWSTNGKEIASGGEDKTAQIWNAATGDTIITYKEHKSAVTSIAWYRQDFTGGTSFIASGDEYGVIHVWNYLDGSTEATLSQSNPFGEPNPVEVIAWSPQGADCPLNPGCDPSGAVLTAEIGDEIYAWDDRLEKAGVIYNDSSESALKLGLVWSPDGKRLASAISDHGNHLIPDGIDIWDAQTGRLIASYGLPCVVAGYPLPVSLTWSPDGKRLASGTGGTACPPEVEAWDAETGGHPYFYTGYAAQVNTVAWSPDGKRIASGGDDQTVQVWQAP